MIGAFLKYSLGGKRSTLGNGIAGTVSNVVLRNAFYSLFSKVENATFRGLIEKVRVGVKAAAVSFVMLFTPVVFSFSEASDDPFASKRLAALEAYQLLEENPSRAAALRYAYALISAQQFDELQRFLGSDKSQYIEPDMRTVLHLEVDLNTKNTSATANRVKSLEGTPYATHAAYVDGMLLYRADPRAWDAALQKFRTAAGGDPRTQRRAWLAMAGIYLDRYSVTGATDDILLSKARSAARRAKEAGASGAATDAILMEASFRSGGPEAIRATILEAIGAEGTDASSDQYKAILAGIVSLRDGRPRRASQFFDASAAFLTARPRGSYLLILAKIGLGEFATARAMIERELRSYSSDWVLRDLSVIAAAARWSEARDIGQPETVIASHGQTVRREIAHLTSLNKELGLMRRFAFARVSDDDSVAYAAAVRLRELLANGNNVTDAEFARPADAVDFLVGGQSSSSGTVNTLDGAGRHPTKVSSDDTDLLRQLILARVKDSTVSMVDTLDRADDPFLTAVAAELAFSVGDDGRAFDLLVDHVDRDPQQVFLAKMLAQDALAGNRLSAGIAALRKLVIRNPTSVTARASLSELLAADGDLTSAVMVLIPVESKLHQNEAYRTQYADLLAQTDNRDRLVRFSDELLAAGQTMSAAHGYEQAGRFRQAANAYRTSLASISFDALPLVDASGKFLPTGVKAIQKDARQAIKGYRRSMAQLGNSKAGDRFLEQLVRKQMMEEPLRWTAQPYNKGR
ncbi:MAG: hypothetical protein AAGA22_00870 [Pseudomonadota bacterium]